MNLYQEVILDHYRNPVGSGLQENFNGQQHQVNPICGDEITVRALVEGGRITRITHMCQGCSISQASASVMVSALQEIDVVEASKLIEQFIEMVVSKQPADETVLGDAVAFAGVGRYPARVNCALMPWKALSKLIESEAWK
jgi:nitrogen fixation NifU-like protein